MTSEANASWRIQLFQSLRVQRGDLVVERFETRRAAFLLAYLAFYPHRVHTREEIAEMLWPEEDLEVTRLRLRQVLNTVRRALDSPDNTQDSLVAEGAPPSFRHGAQAIRERIRGLWLYFLARKGAADNPARDSPSRRSIPTQYR